MSRAAEVVRFGIQGAAKRVRPNSMIDERISVVDLLCVASTSGVGLLRGTIRSVGSRTIDPFLCGYRVRLQGRRHIAIGRGTLIEDGVVLYARGGGKLVIGPGCVIGRGTVIELASGVRHAGGDFHLGAGSSLAEYCYVGAAGDVTIGSQVMMGQFVSLHSENHLFAPGKPIKEQGVVRAPIVIQDDSWLGAGVRVLAGVTIGSGAVVAAGAVVTSDVPSGALVAGVPARRIGSRS